MIARRTRTPKGGAAGGQVLDAPTAPPDYAASAGGAQATAQVGGSSAVEERKPDPMRRTRRSAAGGRWWIWVGRAVLWAFIIVIAVNGGRAAFVSFTQDPRPSPPVTEDRGNGFPASAAGAYAQQFATVYLDYDEASASTRADDLAAYLPEGVDPQLGWNGAGRLRLTQSHVAGVDVRDDTHAVVNLAVLVNGKWMRLAVPVYAAGDRIVVSGQPAILPNPPKASLPASPGVPEVDERAVSELERQLPGFFKAYAISDDADLERYLDQGESVKGLSGTVRFASLQDVIVPPGGDTRKIVATVVWRIPSTAQTPRGVQRHRPGVPAGELEQTYELTVTKQNGNWYVKDIRGSTMQSGQ